MTRAVPPVAGIRWLAVQIEAISTGDLLPLSAGGDVRGRAALALARRDRERPPPLRRRTPPGANYFWNDNSGAFGTYYNSFWTRLVLSVILLDAPGTNCKHNLGAGPAGSGGSGPRGLQRPVTSMAHIRPSRPDSGLGCLIFWP